MEYLDIPSLVGNVFLTLIPVVGGIILGTRTRGRPLMLGLVGCGISAVAALGFVIFQIGAAANDGSVSSILGALPAILTFLQCVGLLLLILAIAARQPAAAPGPPPGYPPPDYPPGPGNYQGPWSQS